MVYEVRIIGRKIFCLFFEVKGNIDLFEICQIKVSLRFVKLPIN